jgi:uncharacterized membrane protein YjfL (UPF0719 family)
MSYFLNALLFALIGIAVFFAAVVLVHRFVPYRLWTEIIEKQNVALAVLVGALSLGLSIIIAAALH